MPARIARMPTGSNSDTAAAPTIPKERRNNHKPPAVTTRANNSARSAAIGLPRPRIPASRPILASKPISARARLTSRSREACPSGLLWSQRISPLNPVSRWMSSAAARAIRILVELGLAALERSDDARPVCRLLTGERTQLDRSATHRACQARLRAAEESLRAAPARAA